MIIFLADFDNSFNTVSDYIAILFGGLSLFFSILLIVIVGYNIHKNFDRLDDPEVLEKYGLYYEGLKADSYLSAQFNVIFMIRRLIFTVVLVFLRKHGGLQLCIHTFTTFLFIIYLYKEKPFEDKRT